MVKPALAIALAPGNTVKTMLYRMKANIVATCVPKPLEKTNQVVIIVKRVKIRIYLDPVHLN